MFTRKEIVIAALVVSALFFLGACGGSQVKKTSVSKTDNPSDLINRLDNDIANARKDQVNVLSPNVFAKAEESLKYSKKGLAEGDKLSEILENIIMGQARLKSARKNAQSARNILGEVIKGRDLARAAGAVKFREYAKAEEGFLNLTRAIEKKNVKYARKNKGRVSETFRRLELRAIKIRTLGEVRKLISKAKKSGTHKIVPRLYALAIKKLNEADQFITKNPYKKEMMRKKANNALFQANRMNQIARYCKKIEDMEPENIALSHEALIYKIAEKATAPDMRNHSFKTQTDNILQTIAAQHYDRSFLKEKEQEQQTQIASMKKKIAELEGQTREQQAARERLMAERRFNQLFSKVRQHFNSREAEIYKKENQLIIRLKAMKFPVGKSVILPSNYPLLSKVQRAVRTFGEVDVVIEGHTDSTGSSEINELLSEQRADAVREYLVANETLPYDKIIAVGYGSTRPLASNKTEKGRAINRRIDMIITPQFKAGK